MKTIDFTITLVLVFGAHAIAQERGTEDRTKSGRVQQVRQVSDQSANDAKMTPIEILSQVDVLDPKAFPRSKESPVFSGPQPGETLPSLIATMVNDKSKGKVIDVAAMAGDKPHVLIIDSMEAGLRALYFTSQNLAKAQGKADFHLSVVFLGDDVEELKKAATDFQREIPAFDVVAYSKDGRPGPGNYGIDRKVQQTVILAKNGKVVHNFPFVRGQTTASPHVMGGIAEILGMERNKFAKLLGSKTSNEAAAEMKQTKEQQEKLSAALIKGGVPREKVPKVLPSIERTVQQFQIEGNWEENRGKNFKLNPEVDKQLRSVGLNDDQVALVVKLAIGEWVKRVDQTGGMTRADHSIMLKQMLPGASTENQRRQLKGALDYALTNGEKATFGSTAQQKDR